MDNKQPESHSDPLDRPPPPQKYSTCAIAAAATSMLGLILLLIGLVLNAPDTVSLAFAALFIGALLACVGFIDAIGKKKKGRLLSALAFGAPFAGGVLWVFWLLASFAGSDYNKGRVLRIRGRKCLPEEKTGQGWHDDIELFAANELTAWERRVLGAGWLLSARMEHASIAAFAKVSLYLSAFGAPAELVKRTHRAAIDEVNHAKMCFAIARKLTQKHHTAGPITALRKTEEGKMDLTRFAIGSLIDGVFAEGLAADVAQEGTANANNDVIARTLTIIAKDERVHAQLGFDILRFCLDLGGEKVRRAVAERLQRLHEQMETELPPLPAVDSEKLARFGLLTQQTLTRLTRARIETTQREVSAVLGADLDACSRQVA